MKAIKLALCLFIIAGLSACKEEVKTTNPDAAKPPATEVDYIMVKSRSQSLQVVLPGRSKSFLEAEVRPQVSGIILSRGFQEGGSVVKGQSLYKIDPAVYEAALESADADLAKANAALVSAKAKADRYRELLRTNAISKQDYEDIDAAYKEALAGVTVANAAKNSAKINLRYTEVIAPISGRIGKSSVTPGALVTANQAASLAKIQQLDPINVDIVQSSVQMLRLKNKLREGKLQATQNSNVKLILEDGTYYEHTGILRFEEVSVDQNTGSVVIRAEFPNPEGILLPGMYVRAILDAGEDPDAILIPQRAVMRNTKGDATVYIINSQNIIEEKVVKTAEVIDNNWRITNGLKDGDKVVVDGLQKVRAKSQVTPKLSEKSKSTEQGK